MDAERSWEGALEGAGGLTERRRAPEEKERLADDNERPVVLETVVGSRCCARHLAAEDVTKVCRADCAEDNNEGTEHLNCLEVVDIVIEDGDAVLLLQLSDTDKTRSLTKASQHSNSLNQSWYEDKNKNAITRKRKVRKKKKG